jgi:hypothetical protein
MTFDFRLEVPAIVPPEEHPHSTYDTELDDVRSILRDLCQSLGEVSGVRFTVAVGDSIPVSASRDLVVVMEQLRDVLAGLREKGAAVLDLYEQGVEAQLVFAVKGGQMSIERRDLLGRSTPPCEIRLPQDVVAGALRSLARTFVDVTARRSPMRKSHPWFVAWAQSLLAAAKP